VTGQRDALQNQLKDTEAKAQQAQKDASLATSQRDVLQNQLKDSETKAQQAQKSAELATGQREALQNQLKDSEAKAQQAKKDAALAISQRDTLQPQPKTAEEEAKQSRQNAEGAVDQSQPQQDSQPAKSDVVPMRVPAPAEGGNEENTVLPKQTPGTSSRSVRQRTHRSREVRSSRTSPESTKAKGPFQLRQLAAQWTRLWQKLRASQAAPNASPR
jgi:chromosome segregation ATPase